MGAPTIEANPDISVEGLVRVPRGVTVQDNRKDKQPRDDAKKPQDEQKKPQ